MPPKPTPRKVSRGTARRRGQSQAAASPSAAEVPSAREGAHSPTPASETDAAPLQLDEDPSQPITEANSTEHPYGTRRSNRNRHPAHEAGLWKRTRDEIQVEVSTKRAKKQAEQAEKDAEEARVAEQRERDVARLAMLEDERAREDQAQENSLVSPSPEDGVCNHADLVKVKFHQDVPASGSEQDTSVETGQQRKKLTPAEKRAITRAAIIGDIQTRRSQVTGPTPEHGRENSLLKPHPELPAAALKNPNTTTHDAFTVDWRRKLQADTEKALTTRRPNTSGPPHQDDPQEAGGTEVGGFKDTDVFVERAAVVRQGHNKPSTAKAPQIQFVEISESEEDSDAPALGAPRKSSTATPRGRAANGGTPARKSKSKPSIAFAALPDWIKPLVKSKIVPSILDYYGTRECPWDPDAADEDEFLDLLNTILDAVYPHQRHGTLVKSDIAYRYCRQRIYDWHHNIQKVANITVQDVIHQRRHDTTLPKGERKDVAIWKWLERAVDPGGAAFYGTPRTAQAPEADVFHSRFLLITLAFHLQSISGSVRLHTDYPSGALALCGAAVQRAFQWYISDQPYGVVQAPFTKENAGALTNEWRMGNVAALLKKPHRFDQVLDAATDHLSVVPVLRKEAGKQRLNKHIGPAGAPVLHIPSSPIRAESSEH